MLERLHLTVHLGKSFLRKSLQGKSEQLSLFLHEPTRKCEQKKKLINLLLKRRENKRIVSASGEIYKGKDQVLSRICLGRSELVAI